MTAYFLILVSYTAVLILQFFGERLENHLPTYFNNNKTTFFKTFLQPLSKNISILSK